MLLERSETSDRNVGREELLEREILEIADHEKELLARELHDGLCQLLAGIVALGSRLSHTLAANKQPVPAAAANEIVRLLKEAIGEVRDLARGLSPIGMKREGLANGLEALARIVHHIYQTSCSLACDSRCAGLSHETETHLMRIAQEAVRNAVTHGRADHIDICVRYHDGSGLLTIRDNGVGLSEDDRSHDGMGLHTMAYRARAIGGSFTVKRLPRGGTLVACAFPLRLSPALGARRARRSCR